VAARETGLFVREEGGEVVFVAAPVGGGGDGVIEGMVYDSTRHRPLAGAVVFTTTSNHTTRTDTRGRFTLRGLPDGDHDVGFLHPYADSLALRTQLHRVTLAGDPVSIRLAIPAASFCAAEQLEGLRVEDGLKIELPTAGVIGFAEDVETGAGAGGVEIEAEWHFRGRWRLRDALYGIGPDHLKGAAAVSEADGRFVLCGLPLDSKSRLRAGRGPRAAVDVVSLITFRSLIVR
jgi:hypothetical protein